MLIFCIRRFNTVTPDWFSDGRHHGPFSPHDCRVASYPRGLRNGAATWSRTRTVRLMRPNGQTLSRGIVIVLALLTGLEPAYARGRNPAFIQLNYRSILANGVGIEPTSSVLEAEVLPLDEPNMKLHRPVNYFTSLLGRLYDGATLDSRPEGGVPARHML